MNKKILAIIGVLVIILGYMLMNKSSSTTVTNTEETSTSTPVVTTKTTAWTGTTKTAPKTTTTTAAPVVANAGKCTIVITNPKPGSSVSFPLVVTGYIDSTKTNTCAWYQNQLRAGDVQISYRLNNGAWTKSGIPVPIITDGSSMNTSISNFTVNLNLLTVPLGVVAGTPIKLTFTELNIATHPNPDHFELDVYAK